MSEAMELEADIHAHLEKAKQLDAQAHNIGMQAACHRAIARDKGKRLSELRTGSLLENLTPKGTNQNTKDKK